jgi:branched-chain amino acid transport system substrate-binding protein
MGIVDRIGLLFTDVSYESVSTRRSFVELALEHAKEAGRMERDVELVERHTSGLPAGSAFNAIREWKGLVEEDGVLAVISTFFSDTGMSLVPTINSGECPTMLMAGDQHLATKWSFNVQIGDLIQSGFSAMVWCHYHGHRRVAIVRDTTWHGEQWVSACRTAARRLSMTITTIESIPASQANTHRSEDAQREAAAAALKRIRETKPEAVVSICALASLAVAQEMQAMGWDIPRVSGSVGFESCRLPECAAFWEGWVGPSVWDEKNSMCSKLIDSWEAKFGSRVGVFRECIGVAYYDAARLLFEALGEARIRTRSGLRDGLERVHYLSASSGAPSTIMGFTPYEHRAYHGADTIVLRRQAGPSVTDSKLEAYMSQLWPAGL